MPAIVDASILVSASLAEDGAPHAARVREMLPELFERFKVAAPALLAYEVANVVHGRRRTSFAGTAEDRAAVVGLLLEDVVLVQPDAASTRREGLLTEAHGLTAYDAAYLELAEREPSSILVTQDRRLLAGARAVLGAHRVHDAASADAALRSGRL